MQVLGRKKACEWQNAIEEMCLEKGTWTKGMLEEMREGAVALCLDFTSKSDLVTVIEAGWRDRERKKEGKSKRGRWRSKSKEEEAYFEIGKDRRLLNLAQSGSCSESLSLSQRRKGVREQSKIPSFSFLPILWLSCHSISGDVKECAMPLAKNISQNKREKGSEKVRQKWQDQRQHHSGC